MGPKCRWGGGDSLCQTSPIPRSPDGDKNAVMGVHPPTVNGKNLQKSIGQELVKREIKRIEKTKTSAHLNPLENYTR